MYYSPQFLAAILLVTIFGRIVDANSAEPSCMVKWLELASQQENVTDAVQTERKLIASPLKVDESTSSIVQVRSLVTVLSSSHRTRQFLDCIGRRSPHCREDPPCRNGGRCLLVKSGAEPGRYECSCAEGFTGVLCERRSSCSADTCQNGGTCEEVEGALLRCHCASLYSGRRCEKQWLNEAKVEQLEREALAARNVLQSLTGDLESRSDDITGLEVSLAELRDKTERMEERVSRNLTGVHVAMARFEELVMGLVRRQREQSHLITQLQTLLTSDSKPVEADMRPI